MVKTYSECIREYGSARKISYLIKEGKLFRLERGLYSTEKYEHLIVMVNKRYPQAVVSMQSAFYYNNLTDVVPNCLHIATARNSTKINDKRICQHFIPENTLNIGVTNLIRNGIVIRTYDLERLCIDLMKNRTKLPYDLYKEVVLSLRNRVHEIYPAKIDDYLDAFPYRQKLHDLIEKEIF